jgi:ABC-type Fe3+-hydroxamate transport system substrate-binding protein
MLKNIALFALLGATFGGVAGCTRIEQTTTTACAEAGATVRTVTDVAGTVTFDRAIQRYKIMAHEAGTIDVVDVGVVCGTLPDDLRKEGSKVVFSGTYKAYPNPPAAPAGYTTYYLEPSSVKAQ